MDKKTENILAFNNIKPPVEGRCGFFVKRKQRYCKMLPAKGNTYCAEHLAYQTERDEKGTIEVRKRIVCPLDKKHTIFEDKLNKHLKKCNATIKKQLPYYEEDVNIGLKNHHYNTEENIALCETSVHKMKHLIDKIKETFKKYCNEDMKESSKTHSSMKNEISKEDNGESVKKHLIQQASLISILSKMDVLERNITFIEFGAGRGALSHWIQKACDKTSTGYNRFFLVDRQHNRNKYDCYHKGEEQGPSFERLNIDIQHLNLEKVEPLVSNDSNDICAVGKHLCGGATDLSLRCLLGMENNGEGLPSPSKKKKQWTIRDRFKSCLFALCCYHRCTWPTYVGKEFFTRNKFTDVDFLRLTKMAAWATCGFERRHDDICVGDDDELKSQEKVEDGNFEKTNIEGKQKLHIQLGLSTAEQIAIGRMCKRLIDQGRLEFIANKGYHGDLVRYVDKDVTLENIALVISEKDTL